MGAHKMDAKGAQCPFLLQHGPSTITCESPIPDASCRTQFRGPGEKQQQYRIFCCDRFESCELYRSIMREKYEEEAEE